MVFCHWVKNIKKIDQWNECLTRQLCVENKKEPVQGCGTILGIYDVTLSHIIILLLLPLMVLGTRRVGHVKIYRGYLCEQNREKLAIVGLG